MKKHSKLETSINSITKPLCNLEVDLSGSLFDFYTDTFSPEFTLHDKDDLKSGKILFPLVFSYHFVYMVIFAALFYFSFQQNIGTIFLSPFDNDHGPGLIIVIIIVHVIITIISIIVNIIIIIIVINIVININIIILTY